MQVPSNALLNYCGKPGWYIGFFTIAWGLVSALTSQVQNFGGMLACRLILGIVEVSRENLRIMREVINIERSSETGTILSRNALLSLEMVYKEGTELKNVHLLLGITHLWRVREFDRCGHS